MLLKLGENSKVVQERLGYHDVSITLNKYSHVIPSMQKDAVKKIKKVKIIIMDTKWIQNRKKPSNLIAGLLI